MSTANQTRRLGIVIITRNEAARVGFTCGFTSQHGAIVARLDPFELPRIKIEGGDPRYVLQGACSGRLDAWRWIHRTLWRLQASPDGRAHHGDAAR
jgi:hypothetical protein